jgi:hypothetical protein
MKRYKTIDRGPTPFHTVEQISANRALTPEGFLLCADVPVARVGHMVYMKGEIPLEAGPDGTIQVERDVATLFAPAAIASYNGKPVVNEHPPDDVRPENWRRLAIGVTLNPRRGEGQDGDVLLADLLITDKDAIKDVQAGKREVSAGYEADYEQIGDGLGRQTNIIGNHIALVERGRCGPRCAIGDHQPTPNKESNRMGTAMKRRVELVREAVRKTFRDAEQSALEALADGNSVDGDPEEGVAGGGDHIHVHLHNGFDPNPVKTDGVDDPAGGEVSGGDDASMTKDDPIEARFKAIEASIAEIKSMIGGHQGGAQAAESNAADADPDAAMGEGAPAGPDDETDPAPSAPAGKTGDAAPKLKAKTNDSAALQPWFIQVMADAEVLVPGVRLMTFDAATARTSTIDAVCAFRRRVLTQVEGTSDGKQLLESVTAKVGDLSKLTCDRVATLFKAAAGAKRLVNNARVSAQPSRGTSGQHVAVTTLAELNKLHANYHAARA